MAKKPLKKAQPGMTVGQTNVDLANKAALEKIKTPAIKPYDMDTVYAASKATADSTYKSNLEAFKLEQQQRQTAAREKILEDLMKSKIQKKGGAIKPITALDQVDKMYKAKYKKK